MESKNDAQAIIDEVKKLHEPKDWRFVDPQNGNVATVAILPGENGFTMKSVKPFLDEYLTAPRMLVGTAKAETLESFGRLVNQHKTANTAIFASDETNKIVAIIDYHVRGDLGAGSRPSFCKHRIEYTFPIAPEFAAWKNASNWLGQNAFAQLLDTRRFELFDALDLVDAIPKDSILYDVISRSLPREKRGDVDGQKHTVFASPADLMTLVDSLSGTSRKTFSEIRVDRFGGMKAVCEKESKVQGDETIPHLFLVQIAAFVGGDKLVLPARIRAKIDADKLMLSAELVGVDRVLTAAFAGAVKEVHNATECEVFRGHPEA
jgi:hypothetical protein